MLFLNNFIISSLEEDIGFGDITTDFIVKKDEIGEGFIQAKEDFIVAGLDIVQKVFFILDPEVDFLPFFKDGDFIKKNQILLKVKGRLRTLLSGERTALNFLQRLSCIATITKKFLNKINKLDIKLVDTRKTMPNFRFLEKYAVKVAGGCNHRMGLFDGVLIKDNHIAVSGGIIEAVDKIKNNVSHLTKIEIEVKKLNQIKDALSAGVDVIMLDNMSVNEIKEGIKLINKKALVEISGGINLDNINELAVEGVDLISVGAITHSAVAIDLSMNITKLVNK